MPIYIYIIDNLSTEQKEAAELSVQEPILHQFVYILILETKLKFEIYNVRVRKSNNKANTVYISISIHICICMPIPVLLFMFMMYMFMKLVVALQVPNELLGYNVFVFLFAYLDSSSDLYFY